MSLNGKGHAVSNAASATIDWEYPEPQSALDRFVGPGATKTELLLQFLPPVMLGVALVVLSIALGWGWTVLQTVVLAVLTIDAFGGVITNATGAAKRWYHRREQTRGKHFTFVATHAAQLIVLTLLFRDIGWMFFAISYGYLMIATVVILLVPGYVQRPVALLCLSLGMLLSLYAVTVPVQLVWFLPVFYLKIFVGHLVREEPYRPESTPAAAWNTIEEDATA